MKNGKKTNLKQSFVELIEGKILSGELKAGDKLPPERELAEELGISRGSVNQGILDLERAGFLIIVPRKGTFVDDYLENATPQILAAIMSYDSTLIDKSLFEDLMQLRILVEGECVRLASTCLTEGSAKMLKERTEALYICTGEELYGELYEYHRCLTRISGNAAYSLVFQSFEIMLKNLIRFHYSDEKELQNVIPQYSKLTEALLNSDTEGACSIISSILGRASEYLNSNL